MTLTKRRVWSQVAKHALLILLAFVAVFPLYWLVISSFKDAGEIYSATLLPLRPTLENYLYALQEIPLLRMLGTSIVVSLSVMACQIVTSVLTAYAMIRWEFRGKKLIYGLLTLTWLVPFQAIMVPNYVQVNAWGLKGNPLAIILPYLASAFACISMYQSFQAFPKALLDAARLEGRSELRTLFHIVLPNMKSTIASLGILLFINSWNEYMWPMLVVNGLESAPIQIGLKSFLGSDTNSWGSLMAATTISCIPILVLYLFMQKRIVKSFMKWGIK
jgi:sn-glycerol 3-phosphate transport system permease protein